MRIIDYFEALDQSHWLGEIQKSDWGAGQFLYELLRDHRFRALCGEKSRVLLLTEGDQLLAFCTYAEQDEIPDETLTPWTGFVYTFPAYRGRRLMGVLLEEVRRLAKEEGFPWVYISTDHVGLYEKYGCTYWTYRKDIHGGESRIYRLPVQ